MIQLIVLITALLFSGLLQARELPALDVSRNHDHAIGQAFALLAEDNSPLTLSQAQQRYQAGDYITSPQDVITEGIGSKPLWLVAKLYNPTSAPVRKELILATAWLDRADVYFVPNAGGKATHLQAGDTLPFEQRWLDSRHFTFDYQYPPGMTLLYLRAETPGPMTLPMYLRDHEQHAHSDRLYGYLYGFIYGVVVALMLYNLILAISLRNPINLYYSVFMLAFLAMNLTYTGHGYAWLWHSEPVIQRWAPTFFMGCYMVWGLLFGVRFLNLKHHIPWLHRAIITSIAIIASTLILSILAGAQKLAIHLAFMYMVIFAVGTLILGGIATWHRLPSASYFLAATLLGVSGALITTSTIWGLIQFHPIAYMAVDIGMTLEAVLLSLALAHQFNQIKHEKLQAEHLARIDPLTGLINRRALDELANPIWSNAERNHRSLSLIMIDIDHFKMINDQYGHPIGDKVIQEVAAQLKQQSRAGDILARWGGEEFLLLLPETSLQQAHQLAERYRTMVLNICFREDDIEIKPTASFGVATKDQHNDSLRRLITSADNLLYVAKQTGRNRVCTQKTDEHCVPVADQQPQHQAV